MKKKFNPLFSVSAESNDVDANRAIVVFTICSTPLQMPPECMV